MQWWAAYRNYPDLTSAIELVEDMMEFDEGFKNVVAKLSIPNPGTFTEIENPLVRSYIEGKLPWCLNSLSPYKQVI